MTWLAKGARRANLEFGKEAECHSPDILIGMLKIVADKIAADVRGCRSNVGTEEVRENQPLGTQMLILASKGLTQAHQANIISGRSLPLASCTNATMFGHNTQTRNTQTHTALNHRTIGHLNKSVSPMCWRAIPAFRSSLLPCLRPFVFRERDRDAFDGPDLGKKLE